MSTAFIYPVFALDSDKATEAVKDGSLVVPERVPDTEVARGNWMASEAAKYDQFHRLVSITVNSEMYGCVYKKEPEIDLLRWLWHHLNGIRASAMGKLYAGGWRSDLFWPRLLNMSIKHGLPIHNWAKNNPFKRYQTFELLEISNIYACGAHPIVRPLPPLHLALKYWLGDTFMSEDELLRRASLNELDESLETETCRITQAMHDVLLKFRISPEENI